MFKEKLTGIESESAENSGSSIEREKELRGCSGRRFTSRKRREDASGTTSSTEGERKKVISKSKIYSRVFLLFLRILLSGLLLSFFFLSLSYVTCRMLVGFVYCLREIRR